MDSKDVAARETWGEQAQGAGLPEGFVVKSLDEAKGGEKTAIVKRIIAELEQFRATGLPSMGREFDSKRECKATVAQYRWVVQRYSRPPYRGSEEGCDRLRWAKVYERGLWMIVVNTEVEQ